MSTFHLLVYRSQWRNSGGGWQSAPLTHREISADLPGKEREGKRENGEEKKENKKKGKWKIENGRGKVTK